MPCFPLAGHSGRQRRPHKALQGFWGLQRKPTFRGCSNFSLADLGVAVFERKNTAEKGDDLSADAEKQTQICTVAISRNAR